MGYECFKGQISQSIQWEQLFPFLHEFMLWVKTSVDPDQLASSEAS